MDLLIANASEIGGLEAFYCNTDYGGSAVPSDRVVHATAEERIIGVGRLFEKEGVLVLRGIRVMKNHSGR